MGSLIGVQDVPGMSVHDPGEPQPLSVVLSWIPPVKEAVVVRV
jgi:hypothetical protein